MFFSSLSSSKNNKGPTLLYPAMGSPFIFDDSNLQSSFQVDSLLFYTR